LAVRGLWQGEKEKSKWWKIFVRPEVWWHFWVSHRLSFAISIKAANLKGLTLEQSICEMLEKFKHQFEPLCLYFKTSSCLPRSSLPLWNTSFCPLLTFWAQPFPQNQWPLGHYVYDRTMYTHTQWCQLVLILTLLWRHLTLSKVFFCVTVKKPKHTSQDLFTSPTWGDIIILL
jgi:hypothetical protein